jgi:hypothetical protein
MQDGAKRVVFFGGLYFKYRILAPVLPGQIALRLRPLSTLRSSATVTKTFSLEYNGDEIEVEVEDIGNEATSLTPTLEATGDEQF